MTGACIYTVTCVVIIWLIFPDLASSGPASCCIDLIILVRCYCCCWRCSGAAVVTGCCCCCCMLRSPVKSSRLADTLAAVSTLAGVHTLPMDTTLVWLSAGEANCCSSSCSKHRKYASR